MVKNKVECPKKECPPSSECLNTIKELKEIINGFGRMSGLALAFVNLSDRTHWISDFPAMSDFCRMIRDTPIGKQRCEYYDFTNSQMMVTKAEKRIYKCHAGLWEFGIPIIFRKWPVAAICGGQFRPSDFEEADLERLANELSLDKTEVLAAFERLKIITKNDIKKIISSLDYLAQTIVRSAERQRVIEEAIQIKGGLESYDSNPDKVLQQICSRCKELVGGADHGCILRRDPFSGRVTNMVPCQYGTGCKGEEAGGLIQLAIKNKEAILVQDAQNDSRYDKKRGSGKARAKIVCPIFYKEEVMGVINLSSYEPNSFDESDKELIRLFARQASMAIRAAEHIDNLRSLSEAGLSLASALDLPNVLRNIVKHLKQIINADIVILYSYNNEHDEFTHPPICDGEIYNQNELDFPVQGDSLVRRISIKKDPYFTDKAEGDPLMDNRFVKAEKIASSAGIPLRVEQHLEGVLFVNFRKVHYFTEEEKSFIEMFGALSSVAINRAQLLKDEELASKARLTFKLAHNIINPLGIIKASADIARNMDNDKDSLMEELDRIKKQVDRVSILRERLLRFGSSSKKDRVQLNINNKIKTVLDLLRDEGKMEAIQLSEQYNNMLPDLFLDDLDMEIVLMNILRNAIDSMPSGGIIRITTKIADDFNKLEIIVKDSGIGISSNMIGSIFDPFFSTKEDSVNKGTGLGLSESKSIMKNYGGTIKVHSIPDKGSIFTIIIPLKENIDTQEKENNVSYLLNTLREHVGEDVNYREVDRISSSFAHIVDDVKTKLRFFSKSVETEISADLAKTKNIFYSRGSSVGIIEGKLYIDDCIINENHEIVDEIVRHIDKGDATIFQIIGREAVRISTTVKDSNGKRAINTPIFPPIYYHVVDKKKLFIGRAWVVNSWHISAYDPVIDKDGNVIAILYIGIPEQSQNLSVKLMKSLEELKTWNYGYIFILDSEGKVLFHPKFKTGYDLSECAFITNTIKRKNGWGICNQHDLSESEDQRVIVHYSFFSYWNWIICAASPLSKVAKI